MRTKNINDYVDELSIMFPELTKKEIEKIVKYGWKQILYCIKGGNDLSIVTPNFFFFIGKIPKNSLKMFKLYHTKLAKKIAFMFKRTKSKWDGHYYFARSENQYIEYLKQNKKKNKIFKDVFLYKLLEELKVAEPSMPYIFRLSEDKTSRMKKYYKIIKTDKAELIIQRDPLNMESLMISNNKYKYI